MSSSNTVIVIEKDEIKYIFTDNSSKFTIVNLDIEKFNTKDLVRLHPKSKFDMLAHVKVVYSEATHTAPKSRKADEMDKKGLDMPLNSGHFYRAFELGLVSAIENAFRDPTEDDDFPLLVTAVLTENENLNGRLVDKLKQLWYIGYDEFAEMEEFIRESRSV